MRIVIADDHPLFLLGLQHGLQAAGLEVLAAVTDGEAAIDACRRWRPDAAVLDVRMPRLDGISACEILVGQKICAIVAILTTWMDAHVVGAAQEAGARAMLSKEADAAVIARELERLAADDERRTFPARLTPALSAREMQVLDGLARGLTRKGIAGELRLSPETIKDHVASLFAKLEAHDRVTAVTQAVSLGVMPLPPVGGSDRR